MEFIFIFLMFGGGYIVGLAILVWTTLRSYRLTPILLSLLFVLPQHSCAFLLAAGGRGAIIDGSGFVAIFVLITVILIYWYTRLLKRRAKWKRRSDSTKLADHAACDGGK
jgi:Na+-transporting methylmalonyl-CoA/oxaloacetate decarboxylase gamma subunit